MSGPSSKKRKAASESKMPAKSWVDYDAECEFPIQNIPFGVYQSADGSSHVCTAIGGYVVDLYVLADAGLFSNATTPWPDTFKSDVLNDFMTLTKESWREAREAIQALFDADNGTLRDNADLRARALVDRTSAKMLLPARVGDYTDFYSSRYHAVNLGTMFRGKDNALQPNWTWIPIGYHGRASSIVVSGTDVVRPRGQLCADITKAPPVFGASKLLDFELEMAFFVGGPGNALGQPIRIEDAEDSIFGMVLFNDWSARDIQKWEYVPLGPFGGKNFASTISPWVVTMDALRQFRVAAEKQDPAPLSYLADPDPPAYDIQLQVFLKGEDMKEEQFLTESNAKYLYWTFKQQLVHHSITGCNMRPGDLLASGTISGPQEGQYGSMIELCWKGTREVTLKDGSVRKFLKDGDTVTLRGFCQGDGYRVGFGRCEGTVLPALTD